MKRRLVGIALFAVIVGGGAVIGNKVLYAIKGSDGKAISVITGSKVEPINDEVMAATINSVISQSPLDVSVSITDLDTTKAYHYGDDASYEAASTTKLLTAVMFLHQVEIGKAKMSDNIAGQKASVAMQKLIVNSDNDAWDGFIAKLTFASQEKYAHSLGLSSYNRLDNTITSNDIASLLTQLYQNKLLNKTNTDLLLGYMKQASERQYIVANIPAGVTVYHKVGYLDDRAHDAAIITNGKRSYVLTIFTKDPNGGYDETAGEQVFQQVTAATLKAFLTP
jgi:beta-lactamase class A